MLSPDEKEEIIYEAMERLTLAIPDIIGNLMANHAALHKINAKFYNDYPEFRDRKDVVQSVVEMIEGKNPLLSYEEILEKSVPEVRRRLAVLKQVDETGTPKRMETNFKHIKPSGNGVI
ncbi:hypothetical protein KO465_04710 [Candidatus Micrarchaeota archaeon]|jgi:hypothetical protein|nr:hypothetical protein [Candidatus Micrarchaeota archaeon]